MTTLDSKVIEALKVATRDGKITCTAARKIAEEFQIPVGQVGDAANSLKIKIQACELGCF